MKRRDMILGAISAPFILSLGGCTRLNKIQYSPFAQIEKEHGGRLGVCVYNPKSKQFIGYRTFERFGMCSTFKMSLAAIILQLIDAGKLSFTQEIAINKDGLRPFNDIVEKALLVGKISIKDAIDSIVINSDNICANGLLAIIGGPQGYTKQIRLWGDKVTRLDRTEPHMNLVNPNDESDTTTPLAHAHLIETIFTKKELLQTSQDYLFDLMVKTKTGAKRLRAGLPKDWLIGDKTGTGINDKMANKYNDIAMIYPPNKSKYIVTCYYESDKYYDEIRDIDQLVLQKVGQIAGDWIKKNEKI
jgi:beta-lactamase class A